MESEFFFQTAADDVLAMLQSRRAGRIRSAPLLTLRPEKAWDTTRELSASVTPMGPSAHRLLILKPERFVACWK